MTTQPLHELLVEQAVSLVRPLAEAAGSPATRDRLLRDLGWNVSGLIGLDLSTLDSALHECKLAVDALTTLLQNGSDDLGRAVACLYQIGKAGVAVADAVERRRGGAPPGGSAAPPDEHADPYLLLLTDLGCYLLDAHLAARAPRLRVALDLIRVRQLRRAAEPVLVGTTMVRDDKHERPFYDLAPLGQLLRDPVGTVRARIFEGSSASTANGLADL